MGGGRVERADLANAARGTEDNLDQLARCTITVRKAVLTSFNHDVEFREERMGMEEMGRGKEEERKVLIEGLKHEGQPRNFQRGKLCDVVLHLIFVR